MKCNIALYIYKFVIFILIYLVSSFLSADTIVYTEVTNNCGNEILESSLCGNASRCCQSHEEHGLAKTCDPLHGKHRPQIRS